MGNIEEIDIPLRVDKAKRQMIIRSPFYGAIVSKRPITFTEDIPPGHRGVVSPRGHISIAPSRCQDMSVKNFVNYLAGMCIKYAHKASLRRKHRDKLAWEQACSKVYGDILWDAKIGQPIEGTPKHRDARFETPEDLYEEPEELGGDGPGNEDGEGGPPQGGSGGDSGEGNDGDDDNGDGDGESGGDSIVGEGMCLGNGNVDQATASQIEAETNAEIIQAAIAAKQRGRLPAHVEWLLEEILRVETDWWTAVENFMLRSAREDLSWRRPNRRFISQGIYLPGVSDSPRLGPVVLAFDTSFSIATREGSIYAAHINRILETCNPEEVIVVYCSMTVTRVERFLPDEFPVRLTPAGRGGTAFKPVFDWIDENHVDPDCIIYFTDGEGDQRWFTPKQKDRTLWLTTDNEDFPWGTVIPFSTSDKGIKHVRSVT